MNNYQKVIIIFLAFMIVRLLINFPKYLFLKKALRKQDIFVKSNFNKATKRDKNRGERAVNWLEENQLEIEKVVLNTGIDNQTKSYMEPLGFGYTQQQGLPVLRNLALLNPEILQSGKTLLRRAKGYYKSQSLKCFNPIFWIEFIVFLPREILNYFSFDKNVKFGSTLINLLQILYWIATTIFMYLEYAS